MPSAHISGTFTGGSTDHAGALYQGSAELLIPAGVTSARLTLTGGLTANDRVRTQRSTDGGDTWTNQTVYNSDQNATNVTVVPGHRWRIVTVNLRANRDINYLFTVES